MNFMRFKLNHNHCLGSSNCSFNGEQGFFAVCLFLAKVSLWWHGPAHMNALKTILVVEDDPNDQHFILQAFRTNGVTGPIHAVNNGLEAIAYLMGEGAYADRTRFAYPSFIITDLKMPKADGFTVLEHLKHNPDWAIIPVVILSGSTDPDDIRTSYLMGASCYHAKPQGYTELRQLLKILYDYWMTCQIPDVDVTGKMLSTKSSSKLGERFPHLIKGAQERI
ncbi:MAG TPA: response regulator [Clostridia bacterium]|nr:response regulator [Clostridia bacterium]